MDILSISAREGGEMTRRHVLSTYSRVSLHMQQSIVLGVALLVMGLPCCGETNVCVGGAFRQGDAVSAEIGRVRDRCLLEIDRRASKVEKQMAVEFSRCKDEVALVINAECVSATNRIAGLCALEIEARGRELKNEADSAYKSEMGLMQCFTHWIGWCTIAVMIVGVVIPIIGMFAWRKEVKEAVDKLTKQHDEMESRMFEFDQVMKKMEKDKKSIEDLSTSLTARIKTIANIADTLDSRKKELDAQLGELKEYVDKQRGDVDQLTNRLMEDTENKNRAAERYLKLVRDDVIAMEVQRYVSQASQCLDMLKMETDASLFRKGIADICYAIKAALKVTDVQLLLRTLAVFQGFCSNVHTYKPEFKKQCLESMSNFEWRFTSEQLEDAFRRLDADDDEKKKFKCALGTIRGFMRAS